MLLDNRLREGKLSYHSTGTEDPEDDTSPWNPLNASPFQAHIDLLTREATLTA